MSPACRNHAVRLATTLAHDLLNLGAQMILVGATASSSTLRRTSMIRLLSTALVTVGLALPLVTLDASDAHACGGFFCDAGTQSPIFQAGERIVFAPHDGLVTMHIEIQYQGDPTTFAWLLPIPELPTDAAGNPLPLDRAVEVSSTLIFDQLQSATNPQFTVDYQGEVGTSECEEVFANAAGGGADAATSADTADSGSPPVAVLEEAEVGPYDAQLIDAESSDALYAWLNDNGYYQDPSAQSVLSYYVGRGYKFIGVKLQNGKGNGDLKPLSLTMSEQAPCVPLRLTGIAATGNMPMLVFVIGEGRAVPKNYIAATVNPQAISFPFASNYFDVLNEAIDTASGRAWVTEFAGPAKDFGGRLIPREQQANVQGAVASAETLAGVLEAIPSPASSSDHLQDILRDEIPMPEGLMGYPFGDCWYGGGFDGPGFFDAPGCEDNASHVTTEAEFYGFLSYWLSVADDLDIAIDGDLDVIKARVDDEILRPLLAVEALLAPGKTLTRFYTTMDPDEMTKDPLFAFNDELPDISNDHRVQMWQYNTNDCLPYKVVEYPDGSRYTFQCDSSRCRRTTDPVPGAPALDFAEVLDEDGPPVRFGIGQADEVDAILNMAEPGSPSLPSGFEAEPDDAATSPTWPNPPPGWFASTSDNRGDWLSASKHPSVEVTPFPSGPEVSGGAGCSGGNGAALVVVFGLFGMGLLVLSRRRDRVAS